jgi:hypothetical protein
MIKKAVYSFYSHPFRSRPGYAGFTTLEDFLNAWTLSVNLAWMHFDEVELVTDNYGKTLLVNRLNLPFTSVIDVLDVVVPEHIKDLYWTFGKLWAYYLQEEPFIHIDYDVFLWKKLPEKILTAPMFGQNTESEIWNLEFYRQGYKTLCGYLKRKPSDWVVIYPHIQDHDIAVNTGVIGGNNIKFLKKYASAAIEMLTSHENKESFEIISRIDALTGGRLAHSCNVVTEQYLYSKLCFVDDEWNSMKFVLDEKNINSKGDYYSYLNSTCREIGYTHLIGHDAKRNADTMRRLRKRVQENYSHYYEKIQEIGRKEREGCDVEVVGRTDG